MKKKITIEGRNIKIKGSIARHEIVRKVVNTFIEEEYLKKGKGILFRYPVEKLQNKQNLYIARPGYKKNFDFYVDIPIDLGLGKEKQVDIALDLRKKKRGNKQSFKSLQEAIDKIYHCEQNDVDILLKKYPRLRNSFKSGIDVETILKLIKWMFIMEDIVYWDNEGRAFLYNFLRYITMETNNKRLEEAFSNKAEKNPNKLKSFMKKSGLEWIPSKG
jgi:hypothetical protein